MTRAEVRAGHVERLQNNRHLRYMWIPYEDAVVVVACNLENESEIVQNNDNINNNNNNNSNGSVGVDSGSSSSSSSSSIGGKNNDEDQALQPLRDLARCVAPATPESRLAAMSFADLRDLVLMAAPLDTAHVRECNAAEAAFWRGRQGVSDRGTSDAVLAFECGGQQWVNEVAFGCGTLERPNLSDLDYMEEILELIEEEGVPAPSPIEQRWTLSSTCPMSIAYDNRAAGTGVTGVTDGDGGGSSSDTWTAAAAAAAAEEEGQGQQQSSRPLHTWVGIIMYLCAQEPDERARITEAFHGYRRTLRQALDEKYGAHVHWAKQEVPSDTAQAQALRARLRRDFPIDAFNRARQVLDPNNILANETVNGLFGIPSVASAAGVVEERERVQSEKNGKESQI